MRGNVQDILVIAVFVFFAGIVLMIAYLFLANFGATAQIAADSTASEIVTEGMSSMKVLANSLLFLAIAFGIASIASAFFTQSHPVFLIFSLIMFAIVMIPITIFSEVFLAFASTSQLLPVAAEFTLLIKLMTDMPVIAVALGILIIIALYAKRNDLQNRGGMA